jgi:hypothetical protein
VAHARVPWSTRGRSIRTCRVAVTSTYGRFLIHRPLHVLQGCRPLDPAAPRCGSPVPAARRGGAGSPAQGEVHRCGVVGATTTPATDGQPVAAWSGKGWNVVPQGLARSCWSVRYAEAPATAGNKGLTNPVTAPSRVAGGATGNTLVGSPARRTRLRYGSSTPGGATSSDSCFRFRPALARRKRNGRVVPARWPRKAHGRIRPLV